MILALEDVWLRRGDIPVLRSFSLAVKAGEVLVLLGPSGSGKTTVLRVLLGFAAPDRGVVRLGDGVVSQNGRILRPPEERGLGVVFQDLALWPHLTVLGNLAFGLAAKRVPRAERERRIAAILEAVGLSGLARRYPGQLSGGERQRVAIARALVLEPRAVLFDEPLSNLDVGLRRDLLALFRALLRERRTTALYVTHDIREAAALGDRIAVMAEGRVQQVGALADLRSHPASELVRAALEELD